MSIPTITVNGTFRNAAGDPMSGTLSFRLNHKLVDATGNVVSERVEIVSTLNASGQITDTDGTSVGLVLYCTSGGDIAPAGLVYDVAVKVGSRPHTVKIALPDSLGSTVDWADLVPVPSTTGVVWTVPDLTAEQARDLIDGHIVAGQGITKTVDDPGDTVTIAAEVTQLELDAEATARAAADTAEATARAAAITALSGTYVALTSGSTIATVQAAIDAVSAAGGGEVHLAKGTYTGPLTAHPSGHSANAVLWLPSNVKLTGAGVGQTIIKVANSAAAVGTPAVYAIVSSTSVDSGTVTNVTVEDLTIDGNAGNQTILMHGLRFTKCQTVRVSRVEVRDVLGGLASSATTERFHMEAHRCADVSFTSCTVQATSQTWDTSSGFSANYSTNVSWVSCLARNMKKGMGFTVFASSAMLFANCRAYGCLNSTTVNARGFNCEGSEDVHYVNCTSGGRAAEDASNPFFTTQQQLPNRIGFTCSGGRRVDYIGCNSSFNTLDGLWFTANTNFTPDRTSEDVRIVAGQFSDNGRYGITLDSLALVTLGAQTVVKNNTTANLNGLQFSYDHGRTDQTEDAIIGIRSAAGANRDVQFRSANLSRWIIRATSDTESGSDAGSNLQIISRTDAGAFKATVISIDRASGDITLGNGVDFAVGTSTGTKIGTSSSQKLGFYGTTPIVRPNAMTARAALEALGLASATVAELDAAGILAALLTVDGPGSGLDADTLDGISSAGFDLAGAAASAQAAAATDATTKANAAQAASQPLDADLTNLAALTNAPAAQISRIPYPHTVDPRLASGVQAIGGANRVTYLLAEGCTGTLTNLHVWVGTQSGNISLAVYNSTGSGLNLKPNARLSGRGLTGSRAPTDGVTTNASPTVTSATAAFIATDVGKQISGTNIPANSYIGVVNSATSIGLSSVANANTPVNATASGSGITLTLGSGIACPPGGALATVALDAPITLDPTVTYYFAIGVDNTSATFARVAAVSGAAAPGVHWQQTAVFLCPDPAVATTGGAIIYSILGS